MNDAEVVAVVDLQEAQSAIAVEHAEREVTEPAVGAGFPHHSDSPLSLIEKVGQRFRLDALPRQHLLR